MSRRALGRVLLVSLMLNLGVLGAFGWQLWRGGQPDRPPALTDLPAYLQLEGEPLRHWQEAEQAFLAGMSAGNEELNAHRERLIREIFSATPDSVAIEAERAAIARLQAGQQQLVIAQLLAESRLLDARQRALLVEVLLGQPDDPSQFERLHQQ